jgi:hypothetical protein
MTRTAAERIVQSLLSATAALNETLKVVQVEAPGLLFDQYRRHAGQVMGAIYLDLIKLIVQDYPDLDPGREDGD